MKDLKCSGGVASREGPNVNYEAKGGGRGSAEARAAIQAKDRRGLHPSPAASQPRVSDLLLLSTVPRS